MDVTTQAQILDLLGRLREEHGSAIVIITHDMGVVSTMADRVLVMYAGALVEEGDRKRVFRRPEHPYTQGLLRSVPRVDGERVDRLVAIPGSPAVLSEDATGCSFAPRCEHRHEACRIRPALLGDRGQRYACWLGRRPEAAEALVQQQELPNAEAGV